MSSKKTVILHIGMHKTATSSIQETLYANRDLLSEHDIFYPKLWKENHAHILCSILWSKPDDYYLNKLKKLSLSQIAEFNDKMTNIHTEELRSVSESKILISGEGLSLLSYENTIRLKEFYENILGDINFKVIASFREHVSYVNSSIQQFVKNGEVLEDCIENISALCDKLYQSKVEQYMDIFGKENLMCYKFEDACKYKQGPVGYYLKTLNISENDIDTFDLKVSNVSVSYNSLEIISYVNEQAIKRNLSEVEYGNTYYLRMLRGEKFRLDNEILKKIHDLTRSDALWLRDTLGIDYTNEQVKLFSAIKMEYNEQYGEDILLLYKKLRVPIKVLIKEFFIMKMANGNAKNIEFFYKLVSELEKYDVSVAEENV